MLAVYSLLYSITGIPSEVFYKLKSRMGVLARYIENAHRQLQEEIHLQSDVKL
jgi:hypothetical protein